MTTAVQDQLLVPTDVAAVAASVERDTILKWAERGKLTRYGTRHRRMWDLHELRDLVTKVKGS